MKKIPVTFVLAFAIFAVPGVALACDLDGMPGFHRFNPFAQAPGFHSVAPTPLPVHRANQRDLPKNDAKGELSKKSKLCPGKGPERDWQRDTGNGPISDEGKATFT